MCSNIRQKFATGDYQEYYICVRFLQSTKTVINRLIKKQKTHEADPNQNQNH